MNATRLSLALIIMVLSVSAYAEESIEQALSIASLDAYLNSAQSQLQSGGELYCETELDGELHRYSSCEAFSALQEQGCYGRTPFDIGWELRHEATCARLAALATAKNSATHHFDLDLNDWWQTLPAEVIPMSGGLYSDESWAVSKEQLDKLVVGKRLIDIRLTEISSEAGHFAATLEVLEEDCGETRNRIEMRATLLADLDNDGIAELLIEGSRQYTSDTCSLGSGSSVGASFGVVLKKASPDGSIVVMTIPGIN